MLSKKYRLTKNGSFSYLYAHGVRVPAKLIKLNFVLNKSGVKIGFSVNNKIGKAVVRNKVKRRMRAIMRRYIDRIKPCQAVFIASVGGDQLSYASLCKQMHKCLVKAELLDEKEE